MPRRSPRRIATLSVHTSPLEQPGTGDAGGLNVYVVEVARRLAADPAGGPAPVVVLTSTREASDYGGRIAASPAAGFLPKDQLSGAALRRFLARTPA